MGSFSDYAELEVLDFLFGASAMTGAANLFFALSSTDPTEDGSGITEPSGGDYARKSMANNKTTWEAAAAGQIQNDIAITFVAASADWLAGADLAFWAIFDDLTAGNMIAHGAITTPKPVLNGDTAEIAANACTITLT